MPELKSELNYLNDIKTFQKKNLRGMNVYFANTNSILKSGFFPYHGYLVTGVSGSKKAIDGGKAYRMSTDIMRSEFKVTEKLLASALKSNKISEETRIALKSLRGKNYSLVEYFLRDLLEKKYGLQGRSFRNKEALNEAIDEDIAHLSPELHRLVELNGKVNHISGSYAPSSVYSKSSERDLQLFQEGKVAYKCLNIKPATLQELLREQHLYHFYLDEKLGIGKTVHNKGETLSTLEQNKVKKFTEKWVRHKRFSNGLYEANCNKSTASLAQMCLNREQGRPVTTHQNIQTGTILSYGSKSRMFLHDPLAINPLKKPISLIDSLNTWDKKEISEVYDDCWKNVKKLGDKKIFSSTHTLLEVLIVHLKAQFDKAQKKAMPFILEAEPAYQQLLALNHLLSLLNSDKEFMPSSGYITRCLENFENESKKETSGVEKLGKALICFVAAVFAFIAPRQAQNTALSNQACSFLYERKIEKSAADFVEEVTNKMSQ